MDWPNLISFITALTGLTSAVLAGVAAIYAARAKDYARVNSHQLIEAKEDRTEIRELVIQEIQKHGCVDAACNKEKKDCEGNAGH